MPLNPEQINAGFVKYYNLRSSTHRYSSFDYCFNYFHSFDNKLQIAAEENLEKSCLHLASFVASWGMLRAKSFLLKKSLRFYIPIIKYIAAECPLSVWEIDVHNYNDQNIKLLLKAYKDISQKIPDNHREIVLVSKIMLGVFGNTPAFDDNFTATFREHYGNNTKYRSFNKKSLLAIKQFYENNEGLIEELRQGCKTYNFLTGEESDILYTRAKIIDMIGFGYSYKEKKRR